MKLFLKRIFDELLAKPSIMLALARPSATRINLMRLLNGIQLSTAQITLISKIVNEKESCCFLVFGLGNDSLFWARMNESGRTVFLEDNQFWIDRVKRRSGDISVLLVEYNSSRRDWQKLLASPSLLEMSMPDTVGDQDWDVILVDAPAGYDDDTPGRMKSNLCGQEIDKRLG